MEEVEEEIKSSGQENVEKEVETLRDKITELRSELRELGDQKELLSLRLYLDARKRLVTGITVSILFLTAFGVYSLSTLAKEMKRQAEESLSAAIEDQLGKGLANEIRDAAIEGLRERLVRDYGGDIANKVLTSMNERLQAQIDEAVKQELERLEASMRARRKTAVDGVFADAIRDSYQSLKYYVIVGSSPIQEELQELIRQVRSTTGADKFGALFSDVRICDPSATNPNYAIVIGPGMAKSEADSVLRSAKEWGFRADSFLVRDTHFRPGCIEEPWT